MIGDTIIIKPHHLPPARELVTYFLPFIHQSPRKFVISVSGESGSGKSTLAMAIKHILKQQYDIKSFIFHMDDYFVLPPTSNHVQRLEDINHVGMQEVDLELLDSHIKQVKNGLSELIKPLSHYKENEIRKEIVQFDLQKVILVEGTYTSTLQNIDLKIFIDRTYKDTLQARIDRARDPLTPFVEQVLEIEHLIIKEQRQLCNLSLNNDYEISILNPLSS